MIYVNLAHLEYRPVVDIAGIFLPNVVTEYEDAYASTADSIHRWAISRVASLYLLEADLFKDALII